MRNRCFSCPQTEVSGSSAGQEVIVYFPPSLLVSNQRLLPLCHLLFLTQPDLCISSHLFSSCNLFSFILIFYTLPPYLLPPLSSITPPPPRSAPSQRAPGASPSAHNISSATVSDRPNFSRGVGIRSTFHAGQQRGARDQQGSAYSGGPASPSLSHGNSQARRTHGATGIFSKFTSKFVRR